MKRQRHWVLGSCILIHSIHQRRLYTPSRQLGEWFESWEDPYWPFVQIFTPTSSNGRPPLDKGEKEASRKWTPHPVIILMWTATCDAVWKMKNRSYKRAPTGQKQTPEVWFDSSCLRVAECNRLQWKREHRWPQWFSFILTRLRQLFPE